ncbi:hypothetical protein MWU57_04005 [Isoptericola sp. S6320L]|uniref:hypothetical protein n=1 Tax=Isoptericola sp. S6320L TaxID=2926411 RepID=UPI001FF3278C|nr:hypothetical protein [Isoptericola sp. S6320L]MCK0116187.1 hypothetical protein [Isoptericola sp. S6320L]
MLQRILGAVLVIAGLAAIAFGVATATVLRESDTVVATARPVGDGTLVVTDPGVLDLVDSDVTVTASVPAGQEVTVVVGRDVDVLGWLDGDPYARVTGLADWDTLTTSEVRPEEAEDTEEAAESEESEESAELPDPAGSDMWITELTAAEEVSLRWSDRPGPWMLLAAGTGAAPVEEAAEGEEAPVEASDADAVAPTLTLTWDREVGTPWLWPAVGLGGLLLLIGIVLLLLGRRGSTKKTGRGRRAGARSGATADASPQTASSAPAVESPDDPASPASPSSPAAPASPFGPTSSSSGPAWAAPAAGAAAGAGWPAPAPAHGAPSDAPAGAADTPAGDGPGEEPAGDGRTGTAPVPVAGRFSRRSSRLRRTRSAPEPAPADGEGSPSGATPAPASLPAQGPAPAQPPAESPTEPPTEPPTTTTGSMPMVDGRPLTRRELRRREEERRTDAQSGMGRALRALTGQTPVVRPAPAPESPPAADDAPSTSGRRAAAWRETWGFDPTAARQDQQDDPIDGGTR